MDKEQAIDLLDNLIGMIEDNQDNDYDTAFRMAIEALKAQLFLEGITSDLISRTETVEHLRRVLDVTVPITDYDGGYVDGVEVGISTVSTMPTVQPERQKGEWSDGYRWQRCSLCKQTGKKSWNYCPNCGAKMTISK